MYFRTTALIVLSLALTAPGCRSSQSEIVPTAPASPSTGLLGTSWFVTEIDGVAVPGAVQSTLVVERDERVTGSAGCNRYFAGVQIVDALFRVGTIGSTRIACAADVMQQERRFLDALGAAATHAVEGDALRLMDAAGRTRLRFTRSPQR